MSRQQRQTLILVREADQTHLSAQVAELLPSAATVGRRRARLSIALRQTSVAGTTFCPECGGDKDQRSKRCHECRDGRMAARALAARDVGHRSAGRMAAARFEPSRIASPTPAPPHDSLTKARRVVGEGVVRRQPSWKRHVLVNGVWMSVDP